MNENPTIGKCQAILDIHIVQGDTQEIVLSFYDDKGEPINLAPFTLKMDIKATLSTVAPIVAIKSVGAGLVKDGHVLTIQFGSETLAWKGEEYYYDLLFVDGAKQSRNIRGKIFVTKSVTQ